MMPQSVDLSKPEDIFRTAAADFRSALSEEQRENFQLHATPAEMIRSLQEHVTKNSAGKRSRLLSACALIEAGCQKIEPYFNVISILVQSHPEWACLAWGAIRLVFCLSSHFVSFFEKLASMLEKISNYLPLYEKHMVILTRRASEIVESVDEAAKWRDTMNCLSRSLAYVYMDILQFCDDARRLFPARNQGICYKARIIQDIFWTPFDKRFSKTLERLKEHRHLYEQNLDFVYNEDTLKIHSKIDQEIQKNSSHRQEMEIEKEVRRLDVLRMRAYELKQWIAASDWAKAHDEADKRRFDGSCRWFVEQNAYCAWARVDAAEDDRQNSSTRVLFVTGKPGYGKTVLCSYIIEDLRHRISAKLLLSKDSKATLVAYFYFTNLQSASKTAGAAFRAILAQIIQACQFDPVFIDAASLWHDDGIGQNHASEKEVRGILQLFLRLLGPSYLVFDGLDECSDADEFIELMLELIHSTDSRVMILTRPSIYIPSLRNAHYPVYYLGLENERNHSDIELYLRARINKLVKEEAIQGDLPLDEIIALLTSRANSIFLWAFLMSSYLSLPYLTANERLDAIHRLNRFEGLDSMYTRILEEIQRQTPEKQRAKVFLIFQLLTVARKPLTVGALRAGLAVQKDRQATVFDYIRDFEKVLPQMCGSLVEIRSDGTVDFIHLSIIDFLIQERKYPHDTLHSFYTTRAASEASMAELSFCYLTHEVPDGPLTSSGSIAPQRQETDAQLPLLRYVSEFWPSHAATAMLSLPQFNACKTLCLALYKFVHDKCRMTMWVEALSLFQTQPDLKILVFNASLWYEKLPPSLSRAIPTTFVDTVRRFTSQIELLLERWSTVLSRQPNEIWSPSIQAWSKCEFLFDGGKATVTALSSDNNLDWILIASETSSNSSEVGTIKVLPPPQLHLVGQHVDTSFEDMHQNADDVFHQGWRAMYTIWSLQTLKIVSETQFYLGKDQVGPGGFGTSLSVFSLPVAFSSTLRTVIIADLVLRVRDQPPGGDVLEAHSQLLPAVGCQYTLRRRGAANSISGVRETPHARHTIPGHTCFSQVYHFLSPSGLHLAILEGDTLGITSSWVLAVFEDLAPESSKPSFAQIARISPSFSPYILGSREAGLIAFHPSQTVAAFSPEAKVVIWQFTVQGAEPIEAYREPLTDLGFSRCGQYLHGRKGRDLVVVALSSLIETIEKPIEMNITQCPSKVEPCDDVNSSNLAIDRLGSVDNLPTMIDSTQPLISQKQGGIQFHVLHRDANAGTVALRGHQNDGIMLHATLARTPDSKTLQTSIPTLISTANNNETLRILFNKAAQSSYSTQSKPDIVLPLIFDRQKNTVTVEEQELPYRIKNAGKRALENDEDENATRHQKLVRCNVD